MNESGHPATLEARHPGNQNATRHGLYAASESALDPRAVEVAGALMELPHVAPRSAADEIGRLVALLERVDDDLAERGLTRKNGEARSLVDLRGRLSGRLERWLKEFGATPASRADFAARLAEGGLAAEIAKHAPRRRSLAPDSPDAALARETDRGS